LVGFLERTWIWDLEHGILGVCIGQVYWNSRKWIGKVQLRSSGSTRGQIGWGWQWASRRLCIFYGSGYANHHLGTSSFVLKGIISAVQMVEFISERTSYKTPWHSWYDIVLNVHAPNEDRMMIWKASSINDTGHSFSLWPSSQICYANAVTNGLRRWSEGKWVAGVIDGWWTNRNWTVGCSHVDYVHVIQSSTSIYGGGDTPKNMCLPQEFEKTRCKSQERRNTSRYVPRTTFHTSTPLHMPHMFHQPIPAIWCIITPGRIRIRMCRMWMIKTYCMWFSLLFIVRRKTFIIHKTIVQKLNTSKH